MICGICSKEFDPTYRGRQRFGQKVCSARCQNIIFTKFLKLPKGIRETVKKYIGNGEKDDDEYWSKQSSNLSDYL